MQDVQALIDWLRNLQLLRDEIEDPEALAEDPFDAVPSRTVFDLIPVVLGLKYSDGRGAETAREVRVNAFVVQKGGAVSVRGYCRTRRAPRQFRVDRIVAVIDGDGIVHDAPAGFFETLLREALAQGGVSVSRPPEKGKRPAREVTETPARVELVSVRAADTVKSTSVGCFTALFWFVVLLFAFLVYATWRGTT